MEIDKAFSKTYKFVFHQVQEIITQYFLKYISYCILVLIF